MQTTGHDEGTARGRKLGDRLRKELRAYAIAALYLFVWLGALALFKAALLREAGGVGLPLLSFLFLLAAASVVEEFVVGWLHERSFAQTLAEYGSRSALEVIASCLLTLLVLVPFKTFQEVRRALGPGQLRRVLMQRPQ